MDQELLDYCHDVATNHSDVCTVTRHCNSLTWSQKDMIDVIRNFQEVSQERPITYEMIDLFLSYNKRTLQKNGRILKRLGILKIKRAHNKKAILNLDLHAFDLYLKNNSKKYDELIASQGLTYVDVFNARLKKKRI